MIIWDQAVVLCPLGNNTNKINSKPYQLAITKDSVSRLLKQSAKIGCQYAKSLLNLITP